MVVVLLIDPFLTAFMRSSSWPAADSAVPGAWYLVRVRSAIGISLDGRIQISKSGLTETARGRELSDFLIFPLDE